MNGIDNDSKLFDNDEDTKTLEELFETGGEGGCNASASYNAFERIMKKLNSINEKLEVKV